MKLNAGGSWWSKLALGFFLLFGVVNAMAMQAREIKLELNQIYELNESTQLTLDSIIEEVIEPSPDDEDSYLPGNGVVVELRGSCKGKVERIELSMLSPPYESSSKVNFCGKQLELTHSAETFIVLIISN
jgi:hypothetical protein